MDESVPLEMDNHVLDKEDGCYDHTDATFSDDEEELNNKGKMLKIDFSSGLQINQLRLGFPELLQLEWSACSLL